MYKGWTGKQTPRSDTARLSRNIFRALGIVNGFLRAIIVTMFSVMAVKLKKALKTQLATQTLQLFVYYLNENKRETLTYSFNNDYLQNYLSLLMIIFGPTESRVK